MATLTSEAEFERLYQEFVRRNGGIPTLVADQYNTPASYYNAASEVTLSPAQLAQLQARQAQYNRQAALNTISGEIASNNFTNPYKIRSQSSINNLNGIAATPITITDSLTGQQIQTTSYGQLGGIRSSLSPLSDPSIGGSAALATLIFAGVASSTGVDLEKLILGAGLVAAGVAMFSDLQTHTDSQVADLPAKMDEIDQLTGLQQSFGEMSNDSCSLWNQLMGIMSGAFDGVLDFIDTGIEQFKNFMNSTAIGQVFNQVKGAIDGIIGQITSQINEIMGPINGVIDQITGQIQGLIDNVSGMISDAIAPIMNQIDSVLGPIKDIMNNIGDIANNVMGAVGDMVDQIAGEISGLIDMAANIANKLQSLAMAAAMLDPCKLAVLLNAGSPALAGAAQQLTAPIESAISNISVPTELDPRADPAAVNSVVTASQRNAQTEPGVPQNPFGALATLYQPFNAYLHDLIGSVEGMFGGAFETVSSLAGGNIVSSIGDTLSSNPIMSSLNNITSGLQGTIGDIASNIAPLAAGMQGALVGSSNITGGNTDSEDFSSGGVISTDPANGAPRLTSRLDGKDGSLSASISRTAPEVNATTRVVTERTAEGTITRLEGSSTQIAEVKTEWNQNYKSNFSRVIRDIGRGTGSEIRNYLANATFKTTEQRRESELLYEDCLRVKNEVTVWLKSQSDKFVYTSRTQDRDPLQEDRIRTEYNNVMKSQNDLMLQRVQQEAYEIKQTWSSIKRQSILG